MRRRFTYEISRDGESIDGSVKVVCGCGEVSPTVATCALPMKGRSFFIHDLGTVMDTERWGIEKIVKPIWREG